MSIINTYLVVDVETTKSTKQEKQPAFFNKSVVLELKHHFYDVGIVGAKLVRPNEEDKYFFVRPALEEIPKELLELLADANIPKVAHNAIFDFLALRYNLGLDVRNVMCTYVMANYLLNGYTDERKGAYSLKTLAKFLLDVDLAKTETLSDWSQRTLTESQLEYLKLDLDACGGLFEFFKAKATCPFLELQWQVIPLLAEMSDNGMPISISEWVKLKQHLASSVEVAKGKLGKLMQGKYAVNLNSPAQLKTVLGYMGVHVDSVGKDTLNKLALELPEGQAKGFVLALTEYKHNAKLLSLLDSFTGYIHYKYGEPRLSTSLNVCVDTGRTSASNPNLQQAPNSFNSSFKAKEGYILRSYDVKQMQLFIAALYAQEHNMLDILLGGGDVHAKTMDICGIKERVLGKNANFGFLFSMQVQTFLDVLRKAGIDLTPKEAQSIRDKFFEGYPALARWHKSVRKMLTEKTGFGKPFKHLGEDYILVPNMMKGYGGRLIRVEDDGYYLGEALNSPVQGAEAIFIKFALTLIAKLKDRFTFKLCMLKHDQFDIEIMESQVEAFDEEITAIFRDLPKRFEYLDYNGKTLNASKFFLGVGFK